MKIAISGDWHIKGHRRYNHIKPRLSYWIDLAKWISSLKSTHQVEHLIIAGDILDVPSPDPDVVNTWHECLHILKNLEVHTTHGQHDFNAKKFDGVNDGRNTLLKLTSLHPHAHYYHREHVQIGELNFYFRGWEPAFEPIPSCDVFIGHAYVDGAIVNAIKAKSDVKNLDSCKLAFIGDIHIPQTIKNIVIPGTPLQQHFGDPIDTSIVIFDTETMEYERISPNFPHLKFIKSVEHPDPSDEYVVWKPELAKIDSEISREDLKGIDAVEIVENLLAKYPRGEEVRVHLGRNQLSITGSNEDFDFELLEVEVKNFRSIEHFHHEFNNNLTIFMGPNGSGKSTLVEAIAWILRDRKTKPEAVIRKGSDGTASGRLKLKFNGKIYTITRSRGKDTDLTVEIERIDGTPCPPLDGNNKTKLQEELARELPFIKKLHLFYFKQGQDGLLSEFNDAGRVSLISELAGLTIVDQMTADVQRLVDDTSRPLVDLKSKLGEAEAVLQSLQSQVVEVPDVSAQFEKIKSIKITKKSEYDSLMTTQSDELNKFDQATQSQQYGLQSSVAELNTAIVNVNADIRTKQAESKNLLAQIDQYSKSKACPTCGHEYDESHRNHLDVQINNRRQQVATLNDQVIKLNDRLTSLQSEYEIAKITYDRSTSDRKLLRSQLVNQHALDRKSLSDLLVEIDRTMIDLSVKNSQYQTYLSALNQVEAQKLVVEKATTEFNDLKSKCDDYSKILDAVFGNSGLLVAKLLEEVSLIMNTNPNIKVSTLKTQKNGKVKPTLDLSYQMSPGQWIDYEELSGGQRLYCDLYFLSRIVRLSKVGYIAMDELFKYFDPYNIEFGFETLTQMPVRTKILIFHGTVPDTDFDYNVVNVKLDENGISKFNQVE